MSEPDVVQVYIRTSSDLLFSEQTHFESHQRVL